MDEKCARCPFVSECIYKDTNSCPLEKRKLYRMVELVNEHRFVFITEHEWEDYKHGIIPSVLKDKKIRDYGWVTESEMNQWIINSVKMAIEYVMKKK